MMSGLLKDEDCAKIYNHPTDVTKILLIDLLFEGENFLEKSSDFSARVRKAGNELFQNRRHTEIIHRNTLFYYTKCIALAPKGTEELALGYSNRSVLLLHLKRYQECLIDIDKAIAITKSVELKKKLEDRKEKCLKLLNDLKVDEKSLEKKTKNLTLDVSSDDRLSKFLSPTVCSDILPDASNSVNLLYNETFGRHLIATRDIKPGEVIVNEKGFVCFPNKNQLYLVCSHCLQFAWNAIPCDYCAHAIYCSEACKKEAWQEYHDAECSTLAYFYFLTKTANIVDVMAVSRLLIKAIKKEGLDNVLNEAKISNERKSNGKDELMTDGSLQNDKFRSYYNLMYNKERISNHAKDKEEYYETIAMNILFRYTNLIRPRGSQLDFNISSQEETILINLKNVFVKFRNIFNTNAITYQGIICNCANLNECGVNCPVKRGIIIGPCSSLVNHSCNPNVERMCVPRGKIVLFATSPIKKGEQICESYGTLFTTEKARRQQFLKEYFFFTCKCIACKDNWPTYEEMDFCRDPRTDNVMKLKTLSKFEGEFFNERTSSYFDKIVAKMEFDKETLKYAIKFSEWIYNHFDDGMAFVMSLTYRMYIDTAFYKLFGEKCIMPAKCR